MSTTAETTGMKLFEIYPFWPGGLGGIKTCWIHAFDDDQAWVKFCCLHPRVKNSNRYDWRIKEVKSPEEVIPFVKTHTHCKSPGCREVATAYPDERYPHLGWCDKHMKKLIIATVKSIVDGTHPDLRKGD